MRRTIRLVLATSLALLFTWTAAAQEPKFDTLDTEALAISTPTSSNLLANGRFELDANDDGSPDNWTSDPRAIQSATGARTGKALKLFATDNSAFIINQHVGGLQGGQTYRFVGWVRIPATSDTFTFRLEVEWRDPANTLLSTSPIRTYTAATSRWTQASASFVAPTGATQAVVQMVISNLAATIFVDDFALTATNLLTNAGFEEDIDTDSNPDGWSGTCLATRSASAKYSGLYSMKLSATASPVCTMAQNVANLQAGKRYSFAGQVNIPSTTDAFSVTLKVQWRDAANNVIATKSVGQPFRARTAGWFPRTATLVAPAGTSSAQVQVVASSLNAMVFVDDFIFRGAEDPIWRMFQHDLKHTGRSPYPGPKAGNLFWTFRLAGAPGTPAIAADGTIYWPAGLLHRDTFGYLYAIHPDGTPKWRTRLSGPPAVTAPAIGPDGTIYIHAYGEGNLATAQSLYAIKPDTGAIRWRHESLVAFTASAVSAPTVATDGTIYVGSTDTGLYALNPDGTVKWVRGTGGPISTSPAIAADGTIYVTNGVLSAYTPSGDRKWEARVRSNTSPIIGTYGTIYVGSISDRALKAVRPDGTLLWEFPTESPVWGTAPALGADGTIYVATEYKLFAVNPDGREKCRYDFVWERGAPVVDGNGTIYLLNLGYDRLDAINPNCTLKWSLPNVLVTDSLPTPSPAIGSDWTLYVPAHTRATAYTEVIAIRAAP